MRRTAAHGRGALDPTGCSAYGARMGPCRGTRRLRRGGWTAMLLVAAAVLVGGCPRETKDPERSEDAQSCQSRSDCNEQSCGLLRACVDQLCEAEPSLVVPCLDAGRN